ncbi:MAG: hypothetical protein CL609_19545 [Anaerolineaceae bacterium]|nr:hypothetical protein [Anaerolineaceae bacterium]
MIVRRTFWYITAIVVLAFLATWYTGQYSVFPNSRVVFLRLALLGLFLILVNWVWTWLSIRKMSVQRTQRVLRLQVGNVFEERFEIINPVGLWRLWLDIQDLSEIPGKSSSKVLSRVGPRQNRFYNARSILTQRGSFVLGPTLLRSGDPFGMFLSEKLFFGDKKLIVLPYTEPIEHAAEPPGFLPGGRVIRQKGLDATSFASGVREYQPGDPLSHIHWRSSAKRDRFMVKEFDRDPQADIWVLLDGDKVANFTREKSKEEADSLIVDAFWAWKQDDGFKLPPDTFEYGVSIASSLINFYIKAEKTVGFACADRIMSVIPAEKGERQLGKILETLAFLEGDGSLPVNGLIEAMAQQIPRGSTVVLITPNTRENIQIALEILIRKNLNPVLILIDRESFGGVSQVSEVKSYLEFQNIPFALVQFGDPIGSVIQSQLF